MKNRTNPGGAPIGPKNGWAEWRARRDKAIAKPRRNAAAQKLNKPKADSDSPTSISCAEKP